MDAHKPQRGEREANQGSKEDEETLPPPLPPSSNSSPSHDFSFSISVLPSSMSSPNPIKCNKAMLSTAVDMAPADDIFFHGHLLPLHFVSYSSISPRPSDISIENLSLPLEYQNNYRHNNTETGETRERTKFKSLSSFFGLVKWRKASDPGEKEEEKKKKKGIDVSRFLKKYVTMLELFFFFKGKKEKRDLRRRHYSISGYSNPKERVGWRRRRGEVSAPASMRTSPTNSGLLSAYSDVSTMEEFQSAIQAAIAHCKNSTAPKEEK
ncbi:BRI1 kinase inhibitor 1 [Elaeis guineensis]|uniref:BRI1 kinase inhibitor 1 n=1 Tax=Elaeis guineensis var. tenera TaxID=51953 RepID=A0A6I9S932_ELAGV|nr:BRI1 kinase inhibitor 1 [Elaeis guineensis]